MGICTSEPQEIQNLNLPATTPTTMIFDKICDYLGVHIASVEPYLNTLREQWYYRAIDLLSVSDEMWKDMNMPVPLETQISKYIQFCRENEEFTSFKEPIPTQKHIQYILNQLKEENQLEATTKHIADLNAMLQQNYLLNIAKFRFYMDEQRWNELNVPTQLKVILLQKINCHKFQNRAEESQSPQLEGDAISYDEGAYPMIRSQSAPQIPLNTDVSMNEYMDTCEYKVDPFDTMDEIIDMLSEELFIEKEHVIRHLTPFLQYKYERIYHLSTISKELYDSLLNDTPKCLKSELYCVMEYIQQNHPLMLFYNPNKKKTLTSFLDIDWTMPTDQVFGVLEHDLNLTPGELSQDVDVLMNHFYSNLWDLLFVPDRCWQSMPYYHKYQIVRIRVHDLLKQCQEKYNLNPEMLNPKLPTPWATQYNGMESVEFILFNSSKKKEKFSLYGTDWSKSTQQTVKWINEYLTKNMVKKIQFLPNEHCKNNANWTRYMAQYDIPSHIRFKLNFYAIKGQIHTEDQWLHNYVGDCYLNEPPQFTQQEVEHIDVDTVDHLNASSSLFSRSTILNDTEAHIQMMNVLESNAQYTKVTLLYRASRDGKESQIFREKCCNKPHLLCIVHSAYSDAIFGGYTAKGWIDVTDACGYRKDEKAFIFRLQSANIESKVFKVTQPNCAIFCAQKQTSIQFGSAFLINCHGQTGRASQQPSHYERYPSNYYLTNGRSSFTVRDVEVFQVN